MVFSNMTPKRRKREGLFIKDGIEEEAEQKKLFWSYKDLTCQEDAIPQVPGRLYQSQSARQRPLKNFKGI